MVTNSYCFVDFGVMDDCGETVPLSLQCPTGWSTGIIIVAYIFSLANLEIDVVELLVNLLLKPG